MASSSNITTSRSAIRVGGAVVAATNIQQIEPSLRWQTIVSTFIAGQDCKQSSRNLYSRTLSQFFIWVENNGKEMGKMQRTDILEYKDWLLTDKSNLTAASYLIVVRKFYEWAEACKLYPNIAKGVKTPSKNQAFKKQHLSDNKSAELIALQSSKVVEHRVRKSKSNPDGGCIVEACPTNLRDAAIVNLMLRCGLRCIEVARAKVEDVCFKDERRVLKVWGKGKDSKDDFVVLTDKAWLPIKAYLASRGAVKGGEYLFVSASSKNMKHHDYTLPAKVSEALYDFAQECRMLDGQAFTMCAVANRLDGIRAILSEYMNRDNEVDDGEEETD